MVDVILWIGLDKFHRVSPPRIAHHGVGGGGLCCVVVICRHSHRNFTISAEIEFPKLVEHSNGNDGRISRFVWTV